MTISRDNVTAEERLIRWVLAQPDKRIPALRKALAGK